MGIPDVTNNRYPEHDFILEWLDTIHTTSPPLSHSACRTKRRRIDSDNQDKAGRHRSAIPTPSLSSSPRSRRGVGGRENWTHSHRKTDPNNDRTIQTMPNLPHKRTIHDVEQDAVHSDDDASAEETPKAKSQQAGSRGRSRSGKTRSTGSTPSATSSSLASGTSSPTKQVRYAATTTTGFEPFNFERRLDRLPQQLFDLWQNLNKIACGEKLLPRALQQEVQRLGFFPDSAFYDLPNDAHPWRLLSMDLVRDIFTRATECDEELEGESSWNHDVHSPLLTFAFRNKGTSQLLDYRYCTGTQIIHEYKPLGAPSKSVDYCICIRPDGSSHEAQVIDSLKDNRPGLSINHTSWGNFCKNPIALSIETKGRQSEPRDRALLQIGTWHSAQWRALHWQAHADVTTIGCLPGIIVERHSWYFVASTLEGGRSKLYHRVNIGETDSRFGIYKLAIALQFLGQWIEQVFWPAFKGVVLDMPAPTVESDPS